MTDLKFNDATVRTAGSALTQAANSFYGFGSCTTPTDLGDEGMNDTLSQLQSALENGSLGARTEIFALGQAAVDSADRWTDTDQNL